MTKGFSLVETFISLFILAAVLLLFQAILGTVFLSQQANHQEIALLVAQNKMENLRALGYNNLPSSGSFSDSLLSSLPQSLASITVSDFNVATKQVSARVQWQEPFSLTPRFVSLTTLITKTGGL